MCVSALICFTQAGTVLSPPYVLRAQRGRYHRAFFPRYAMVLLTANLNAPYSEQFLVVWTKGTMRKDTMAKEKPPLGDIQAEHSK